MLFDSEPGGPLPNLMLCRTHLLSAGRNTGQVNGLAPDRSRGGLWGVLSFVVLAIVTVTGCTEPVPVAQAYVWGRKGLDDGRFIKPRAITIDDQDQLYIIDMTSRIQVFDTEGKLLRAWKTPECKNGKPTGLTVLKDGRIAVPDTHYSVSYTHLRGPRDATLSRMPSSA